MITNICILFLKLIVIMCLIGVIIYLVGMVFAIGLGIYLLIKGVTYFGIFILLVALFQAGILLLELGLYFVFNKKIKVGHLLAEVIIIIVLSGFGLALGAIEIANTEIIYDSMMKETKSVEKEIKMSDDLVLYGNYNFIIDDTLTDTIKIEYIYPDIKDVKVNIELEGYRNGYYLNFNVSDFVWNKDTLNEFIEQLKEKKIYIDHFEIEKNVYISSKNKEIMEQNKLEINKPNVLYEFMQTYNVVNIEESNDYNYLYLTIRQFQDEEIATVRVPRNLANEVKENNNYEFTFQYEYPKVELKNGTINEIFEKCNLISIKYTDKVGMGQTQEPLLPDN